MRSTTETMHVSDCQYYFYGPGLPAGWDANSLNRIYHGNGVAAGCPDHLTVLCGTRSGPIRLTIELRGGPPPPSPPDDWECDVELTIHSSGALELRTGVLLPS